ncbi:MAG TPA: FAD-dependent oxidoreductase [Acetobacteraceae bacterium]|nr:FAD-dependent oxidoreductase [Acetobacteraceae bacterium]
MSARRTTVRASGLSTERRPRRFDRNLVVIGAGTAGLVASAVAAKLGASVCLVEAGEMGGDCLNTGCVPSKALIHAARLAAYARRGAEMGVLGSVGRVESAAAMRHVRASVAEVAPHDSEERFRGFGVNVRRGHARLLSPWSVEVGGEKLTTRAIIVATGAEPFVPPIPGLREHGYLTSATFWILDALPARLLILGGGPIACELSQACARLGSSVTVVQKGTRLLEREDDDVSSLVRSCLERDGVRVLTACEAASVGVRDNQPSMRVAQGGAELDLPFDRVLVATGRKPRVSDLGLEALGIEVSGRGTIVTNPYLQTARPSVLACGDVAGPWQFTHAAAHQGWHASVNALFGSVYRIRPDRTVMPSVTYTEPEIGRAGLNEREAKAKGIAVEVTCSPLHELDRAIVDDAREGFVKVLTAPGKHRILGVTVVAPRAGEMLSEFVLAMGRGAGLKQVFSRIHAYPTYTEANRDAAGAWRMRHAPTWLLPVLSRYHSWMRGGT